MGGRIGVESVAILPWNRWPLWRGIGGRFAVEYAGVRSEEFIVDARSGEMIKQWSSLKHFAAVGTGLSQYNGTVSLATNSVAGGFELRDMLRGVPGTGADVGKLGIFNNNVTMGYVSDTPSASHVMTSTTNTWGDGQKYTPNSGPANFQTAGVDVHFGISATWTMLGKVFKRNGVDGKGTAVYAVVHDPLTVVPNSRGFNAYWQDSCFCMRFGDSLDYNYASMGTLDVAAHELAHGLTGFAYALESGGIEEANSDILATMTEFYVRGGGLAANSSEIPNSGGNWTIGEGIMPTPLRYMFKPSKDGTSFDAWFLNIGLFGVHQSSGPINRAFYFLSQGATTSGDSSTTYLPFGMVGIGNDKAAKIWFRAVTTYMTVGVSFVTARQALITAAKDLYGPNSAEEIAVWNAFKGVNVGAAWSVQSCGTLDTGRQLFAGESVPSCNGAYQLKMQSDGNLVLYMGSSALWSTSTWTSANAYAAMQADGNFVVYNNDTLSPAWTSDTYTSPGAAFGIQNDGNLVIRSPNGVPVWYRSAPPDAATIFMSNNINTSFATAESVPGTMTGIKGISDFYPSPRYFKITIPANRTVKVDFVGPWMRGASWELSSYNSTQGLISSVTSNNSNTRITTNISNSTTSPREIYLLVNRSPYDDTNTYSYTVGLSYF